MIVGTMKDYKLKLRILHVSDTQVCAGRKHSTPSIGCHGQAGDTRPGQTRKTPKDLSGHESEERGCGESVGLYVVYIRERGGWDGEGEISEAPSLLSYTLRYVSLAELGHVCQFGLREPKHLCACVREEGGFSDF